MCLANAKPCHDSNSWCLCKPGGCRGVLHVGASCAIRRRRTSQPQVPPGVGLFRCRSVGARPRRRTRAHHAAPTSVGGCTGRVKLCKPGGCRKPAVGEPICPPFNRHGKGMGQALIQALTWASTLNIQHQLTGFLRAGLLRPGNARPRQLPGGRSGRHDQRPGLPHRAQPGGCVDRSRPV